MPTHPALPVLFAAVLAQAGVQPGSWAPAIADETLHARETLASEPLIGPGMHEQAWDDARARSVVPLFHAYLNAHLAATGDPPAEIAGWWTGLVRDDPRLALHAVNRLDTAYLVWDPARWSEGGYDRLLPAYRTVLMRSLFEAAAALERAAARLEEEIDALPELSLTPPGGLPFGATPESVPDPDARAEYAARLAERARRGLLRERLARQRNTLGWASAELPGRVRTLYADAAADETDALARAMLSAGWHTTEPGRALLDAWPGLADRVSTLGEDHDGTP